jgi:hypothetical protein
MVIEHSLRAVKTVLRIMDEEVDEKLREVLAARTVSRSRQDVEVEVRVIDPEEERMETGPI